MNSLYHSLTHLQNAFTSLTPPPAEQGRLAAIVCRRAPGIHEPLRSVQLTLEEGVPGDEWNRRTPRSLEAQLTVMRRDVAELVANGQDLSTSGDNLIVELDISRANLPVGTRLRVGEAVVEVTPKPHNGCHKFARRFGEDALRFVQEPATRHHNLRGVYWKVIMAGEVTVGSPIRVLSRLAVT